MKDLKQNIIDALNDATDFEYDKVNTSIFHEYLDDIFDQIPDTTAQLKADKEELLEALEETNRRISIIKSEHDGIVRETMIDMLPIGIDSLLQKHKQ